MSPPDLARRRRRPTPRCGPLGKARAERRDGRHEGRTPGGSVFVPGPPVRRGPTSTSQSRSEHHGNKRPTRLYALVARPRPGGMGAGWRRGRGLKLTDTARPFLRDFLGKRLLVRRRLPTYRPVRAVGQDGKDGCPVLAPSVSATSTVMSCDPLGCGSQGRKRYLAVSCRSTGFGLPRESWRASLFRPC